MPEPPPQRADAEHTTRLLNRLGQGEPDASAELLDRIYRELHALAAAHMLQQAAGHTLQPTALVHEAFLRLVDATEASYASQGHFYAMASKVMRTVLVDHARAKNSEKRGGGLERVPLELGSPELVADPGQAGGAAAAPDILDMDEALETLARIDADLAEVIELRHFGGLTTARMSEVLGVSERTVERRLRSATAWLRQRLA